MLVRQADQRVLRQLVVTYLPEIDNKLKEHDIGYNILWINLFIIWCNEIFTYYFLKRIIVNQLNFIWNAELSLITLHWFLTIFASVVHTRVLLKIWDVLFYEGSIVLFLITLATLKLRVCCSVFKLFPFKNFPFNNLLLHFKQFWWEV